MHMQDLLDRVEINFHEEKIAEDALLAVFRAKFDNGYEADIKVYFRTHMGHRFYTVTMPQIANALSEIAKKMPSKESSEKISYEDIERHVGHDIVCVTYGKDGEVFNVAIECETCNEVIIDFDK